MTQEELQKDVIKQSVKFFGKENKGVLNLAMRSGKTRISIEVMKELWYLSDQLPEILICYPDNKLKSTWESEFVKWDYENEFVKFVNFSSLKKHVTYHFDMVICDEYHSLSPQEMRSLETIVENATYSLFLSGTISKETKEKWPEFKEIYKFSTTEGINHQILADYSISVHLVQLDNIIKTPNKKGKMLTEKQKYDNYSYVIQQMQRDGKNAMHLALARNRLSLSSIGKMTYLRKLLEKLKDKRVIVFTGLADVADNIGIPSYHSKSPIDDNYVDFFDRKINHLALAAMGRVGVTYPSLDSVILMNFTYNAEDSSQILNRAINLDYHGKVADLHVICLNEPAELKKVKESLSMLDPKKIKYV